MIPSTNCCRSVPKSKRPGSTKSIWSFPAQAIRYCWILRSINQPRRLGAVASAAARCRKFAIMLPPAFVKKCTHASSIVVMGAFGPNTSSDTPDMFSSNPARSRKSFGAVCFIWVNFLTSLSESPVVESAIFSCIFISSSAESPAPSPPPGALLTRG